MQSELIKNEYLSEQDVITLRESFVRNYCEQKNWDKNNLDFEQVLEIRSHNEWKAPGMLKG